MNKKEKSHLKDMTEAFREAVNEVMTKEFQDIVRRICRDEINRLLHQNEQVRKLFAE